MILDLLALVLSAAVIGLAVWLLVDAQSPLEAFLAALTLGAGVLLQVATGRRFYRSLTRRNP